MIVFTSHNQFYIIPTISFYYENGHYFYIDLMWGKWGVSFPIKKENRDY
jgi:hypothetical protein